MKTKAFISTFFLFLFHLLPIVAEAVVVRDDLQSSFAERGVVGGIVVIAPSGEVLVSDKTFVNSGYLPASTFKLLHALIALDTGVVENATDVIVWDGVDRGYAPWNQDQTLETAIRNSTIWVFQRFARAIGKDRMQRYLETVDYGNHNPGGQIDSFWLDGDLRITPMEQVAFVKRFQRNDLPFDKEHIYLVKRCILMEETSDWTMYAKTGWAQRVTPQVGWLTGWVESSRGVWFFATCLEIEENAQAALRFEITREILKKVGAI